MRYRFAIPVFLLLFLLQGTLLNIFAVCDTTPNLILCAVVLSVLLRENSRSAMVLCIFFGLLYDLVFSAYVGPSAIAFLIIYLLSKLAIVYLNPDSSLNALLIAVAASFLFKLIYGILIVLPSGLSVRVLFAHMPMFLIYSSSVIVLVHFIVMRRRRHISKRDFSGWLYI